LAGGERPGLSLFAIKNHANPGKVRPTRLAMNSPELNLVHVAQPTGKRAHCGNSEVWGARKRKVFSRSKSSSKAERLVLARWDGADPASIWIGARSPNLRVTNLSWKRAPHQERLFEGGDHAIHAE
jgi:hypothetical protein